MDGVHDSSLHLQGVLDSMSGHVPLQHIWGRVMEQHHDEDLGDFRGTISNLLDTYGYEASILRTANRLFSLDMYRSVKVLHYPTTTHRCNKRL